MGEVVDFSDHHHLAGQAICLQCRHEWAAIAPLGAEELECPKCKMMKGVFANIIRPEAYVACPQCDNGHFYLTPDKAMLCTRCGYGDYIDEVYDELAQ